MIRNYLLEPTDFAIDYGPEGGSIGSLDDLTVFKELYGYRGTAVTSSFSAELPDGSQDDFADGDTLLADHLESATEFVGINSGSQESSDLDLSTIDFATFSKLIDEGLATPVQYDGNGVYYIIVLPGADGVDKQYLYEFVPIQILECDDFDPTRLRKEDAHYSLRLIGASVSSPEVMAGFVDSKKAQGNYQALEAGLTFTICLLPGGATALDLHDSRVWDAAASAAGDIALILIPAGKLFGASAKTSAKLRAGAIGLTGVSGLISSGQGISALLEGDYVLAGGKGTETLLRLLTLNGLSLAPKEAVIGRKLDYLFGRATGRAQNIERSTDMLRQMERIGLPDTAANRQLMSKHFQDVLNDASNISGRGRSGETIRESLLMGPNGAVKVESIWDGNILRSFKLKGVGDRFRHLGD